MFYNQQLNESYIPADVDDSSFLQEAYFGKNPILTQIEAEFQKIIDSTMSPKQFRLSIPVAKIEELTTELFNFKSTTLGISNIMANACSLSAESMSSTGLEKGEYGVRFKKPSRHAIIVMDINLAKAAGITAGEMTAMYLHEIGHVMYTTSIYTKLFSVATAIAYIVYQATRVPNAMLALAADADDRKEIDDIVGKSIGFMLAKTPIINKIYEKIIRFTNDIVDTRSDDTSIIYGMFNIIMQAKHGVSDAITIIKNKGNIKPVIDIDKLILLPYRYSNEKFADNFATAYGYGPELTSGLSKTHNRATNMFQDALLENTAGTVALNIVNILTLPSSVILGLADPHPSTHNRIKDQINMTKYELSKSDMNPLLIADLNKDLEKLEVAMEVNTQSLTNLSENKNAVMNVVRAICIRTIKTDSLRDTILDLFRFRSVATHQIDIKK